MGRMNSEAWNTIHAMCDHDKLNEELLYDRSKLVLSKYRKLCWQTSNNAKETSEDLCFWCGSDLDGALIYLENFAPDRERDKFESKIKSMFDIKSMINIVDTAMFKVKEFPDGGEIFFEIISKCYLSRWKYTEDEMINLLNMERSRFYDRKKEAVMIFGIALWGTAIPRCREQLIYKSD